MSGIINRRDLEFQLFEVLDTESLTSRPRFAEHSKETFLAVLDLLTPIAKSWPSQWCLEANSLAIQIHGGYGYTREYPVEQFYRDNRLNPIHEGTHGIQALDLLGRKAVMNDGAAMKLFAAEVPKAIAEAKADPSLASYAAELGTALGEVATTLQTLGPVLATNPTLALANAVLFLEAFGHTVLAWIWLRNADCNKAWPPTWPFVVANSRPAAGSTAGSCPRRASGTNCCAASTTPR